MADAAFSCTCGTLRGRLRGIGPAEGTYIACHCTDCRTAEVILGQPDPGEAGVSLYQTTPDRVEIMQGADRLALMRLSPRGLFRWHAACCNAPLFNTPPTRGVPFASLIAARAETPERLGPLRGHINGPAGTRDLWKLLPGILGRMIRTRLSGQWRQSPFFRPDGRPVAEPRIVPATERAAVRSRLG